MQSLATWKPLPIIACITCAISGRWGESLSSGHGFLQAGGHVPCILESLCPTTVLDTQEELYQYVLNRMQKEMFCIPASALRVRLDQGNGKVVLQSSQTSGMAGDLSECIPWVDAVAPGLLLLSRRDSSPSSGFTAAATPEGSLAVEQVLQLQLAGSVWRAQWLFSDWYSPTKSSSPEQQGHYIWALPCDMDLLSGCPRSGQD